VGGTQAQQLVDMGTTSNDLDSFTQKLQQHDTHLQQQKTELVVKVEKKITEFHGRVDSFASRWHELKPKGAPQVRNCTPAQTASLSGYRVVVSPPLHSSAQNPLSGYNGIGRWIAGLVRRRRRTSNRPCCCRIPCCMDDGC
jgi:hypothetical protein